MRFPLIAVAILFLTPGLCAADEAAVTDRRKAGADFTLQGEYTGTLDGKKTGVHLVAEGGGKFSAVLYPGGLPGDGWDGDKTKREKGSGNPKDGIVIGKRKGIMGGMGSGFGEHEEWLTFGSDVLKKVERKSPTAGAAAPAGAVVLFDGSSADAWKGAGMTEDKLLREGNDTKQAFGSYTLHVEFMLPWMPDARGQGRGNSGVYNQSRYEVQVLDSFGLEGDNHECGGIYTIASPVVNMCLPPLQWQTYDMDYTAAKYDAAGKKTANARVTVRHNGTVIHKDVELTHATTSSPLGEGPEPGPLHLQNHGNPVRYRNIWLVEKK